MGDSLLSPGSFGGLPNENAELFITRVKHFILYKRLPEQSAISAIALLLKGGARIWFDGLPESRRDTTEHLYEAFTQRYLISEGSQCIDFFELLEYRQSKSQTVEEYIELVEKIARRSDLNEKQVIYILLKGILPSIRTSVLQNSNIDSLVDVKKHAIHAEKASFLDFQLKSRDNGDLLKIAEKARVADQIDILKEQQSALKMEFDKLKCGVLDSSYYEREWETVPADSSRPIVQNIYETDNFTSPKVGLCENFNNSKNVHPNVWQTNFSNTQRVNHTFMNRENNYKNHEHFEGKPLPENNTFDNFNQTFKNRVYSQTYNNRIMASRFQQETKKCYTCGSERHLKRDCHTINGVYRGPLSQMQVKRALENIASIKGKREPGSIRKFQGNYINVNLRNNCGKMTCVCALIDSGAYGSFVSERLMNNMNMPIRPLAKNESGIRITADMRPMKLLGKVSLDLDIFGEAMPFEFGVAKTLSNDVILGTDFQEEYGVILDGKNHIVKFFEGNGLEVDLCVNDRREQTGLAFLGEAVSLPPMTETIVNVKLSKNIQNSICMLSPLLGRGPEQPLIARALVKPRNRKAVCRILNNSDRVVQLKKHSRVAMFETYYDQVITNIDDWFDSSGNLKVDKDTNANINVINTLRDNSNEQIGSVVDSTLNPEAQEFRPLSQNAEIQEQTKKSAKKHVTFNLDKNHVVNHTCNVETSQIRHHNESQNKDNNTVETLGIQIEKENLTQEQTHKMEKFLNDNVDLFAKELKDVTGSNMFYHHIDTGTSPPIYSRPYRNSPIAKEEISKQVTEMLDADIIEESFSMYNNPCVLVKKKNESFRFCLDFRKLNEVTKPISFPIPTMNDIIDGLSAAKPTIFSSLDLKSGYHQIPLDEESRDKTSFTTHEGSYRFKRLAFGLRNAPASFQMLMSHVFKGLTFKFLTVYLDDVLIYSPDFETHMQHLKVVFQRLRNACLKLHPKKCSFGMSKILYLGHIVSKDGISVDPSKVEVIRSYPRPTSVKDVRAFLGLTGYYRKFQKGYANLATPLYALLRKDAKFNWDNVCEQSFLKLREAMTCTPVLAYPDLGREFMVTTDASLSAIGYILSQKDDQGLEHPIAFSGRSLRGSERNWSVTEVEGLALVSAIQEFKPFLIHRPYKVFSDHISLTWLKSIKSTHGRLFRWSLLLQAYDFEIIYKPGKVNLPADALSRREYPPAPPEDLDDDAVNDVIGFASLQPETIRTEMHFEYPSDCQQIDENLTVQIGAIEDLGALQRSCPDLGPIIAYLEGGDLPDDDKQARRIVFMGDDFYINNDTLYHTYNPTQKQIDQVTPVIEQVCLPKSLRVQVLEQYHDQMSHPGFDRCYAAIRLKYFWPRMFSDIKTYCVSCTVCQRAKINPSFRKAPLNPLPPAEIFSRYHIDYLGPLKTTKEGYKYILLVVESLSRYPEAFPTRTQEAGETANILYNEIFCRYGCPRTLLSDRGTNFCSQLMSQLCKLMKVARVKTSSFHPQTNSICENFNRTIWKSLRTHIGDTEQAKWSEYLPSVLAAFRATPAVSSTGFSPFYVLYGTQMVLPLDNELEVPSSGKFVDAEAYLKQLLPKVQVMRKIAQENIEQSQIQSKAQYDKNAKEPVYEIGDRVWLSNQIVPKGQSKKLVQKWIGPYFITAKKGPCNYIMKDCKTFKEINHPVHSNRLKPYNDDRDIFANRDRTDRDSQDVSNDNQDNDTRPDTSLDVQNSAPGARDTLDDSADSSQSRRNKKKPQWFSARRLLGVKTMNGKKFYRVEWDDPNLRPEWIPSDDVTDYLKEQYHIRRTQTGLLRKEFKKKQRS